MLSWPKITAFITGGASGLGKAVANRVIAAGGKVVIADLSTSKGGQVASEFGSRALFAPVDITISDSLIRALDEAKRFGGNKAPFVAVNCAGIAIARKTLSKDGPHDLDQFARVLTVNTIGSFNVIRLVSQMMSAEESNERGEKGVIVNTASVAAYDGQIGQAAYAASKAAIVGMTLPIARDLAQSNIRICTVAPGVFKTPMVAALPPKIQNELGALAPFPSRLGDPDEFAHLVMSIIENPFLNGETIRIDGALRMPPK
eukprot:TRINITY_DN725_c1_g1_i2.p1 TRINITY_DN725_c1_g1~~TRINITY_DN725_c1_g1_i2.p1  ORF type:complete len:259 (-),score=172.14 TRINITY_DN725_c1_g1_i2:120-896(-)